MAKSTKGLKETIENMPAGSGAKSVKMSDIDDLDLDLDMDDLTDELKETADDIKEKVLDVREEIKETILEALERIKARIERSYKHHKCYEQERAAKSVEGAINFINKSKNPVDDK